MGWREYSRNRGLGLFNFFQDEKCVKFFITIEEKKLCYLVKSKTGKEKQKSKNSYKFIILEYLDIKSPKIVTVDFETNIELLNLIIEHGACNEEYRRHFKISKILKNEKKGS